MEYEVYVSNGKVTSLPDDLAVEMGYQGGHELKRPLSALIMGENQAARQKSLEDVLDGKKNAKIQLRHASGLKSLEMYVNPRGVSSAGNHILVLTKTPATKADEKQAEKEAKILAEAEKKALEEKAAKEAEEKIAKEAKTKEGTSNATGSDSTPPGKP